MEHNFSRNLKTLRAEKGLTQEQVAERLNVSSQAVSRWECGTGTPDIMLLPEIARMYCVTIDDLYKEKTEGYENFAQRLAALYEHTRKPEDFLIAEQEFRGMMEKGTCSPEDIRIYGILHQYMMNYCKDAAIRLFDKVLREAKKEDEVYARTKSQKIAMMAGIGCGKEMIDEQLEVIERGSRNPMDYGHLLLACLETGKYELAYEWLEKSIALFPEDWMLLVYGGAICEQLGKIEEAFAYWNKALKVEEGYVDPLYAKAECHEKLGEKEKARECWEEIVKRLADMGLTYETERAKDAIKRLAE